MHQETAGVEPAVFLCRPVSGPRILTPARRFHKVFSWRPAWRPMIGWLHAASSCAVHPQGEHPMSLLNDLLGGQGQSAGGGTSMISVVSQLVEKAGGVQGLVGMLQQHGLGGAVQSWVGTGSNQPVSG